MPKEKRSSITSLLCYNIFKRDKNRSMLWICEDETELYSEYLYHSYYLRNSITVGSIFVVDKNLTSGIAQLSKDSNSVKLIFCTPITLDFLLQRCKDIFINCFYVIYSKNFVSEEKNINICRMFDNILSFSKINTKTLVLSQIPSLSTDSLKQFLKSTGIKVLFHF
jgi:hypothetical protein